MQQSSGFEHRPIHRTHSYMDAMTHTRERMSVSVAYIYIHMYMRDGNMTWQAEACIHATSIASVCGRAFGRADSKESPLRDQLAVHEPSRRPCPLRPILDEVSLSVVCSQSAPERPPMLDAFALDLTEGLPRGFADHRVHVHRPQRHRLRVPHERSRVEVRQRP